MKKNLSLAGISLLLTLILVIPAHAQEKTKDVKVSISIDGKTIKDTTYTVKDESAAKLAADVLDMTLGKSSDNNNKAYAIVSQDGEAFEWKSVEPDGEYEMKYYFSTDEMDDGKTIIEISKEGDEVIRKKIVVNPDCNKSKHQEVEIRKITDPELESGKIEWIEEDGTRVLIIDKQDTRDKIIKMEKEGAADSQYKFKTEDGETIIIKKVEGDEDKEIEVEVIVEDDNKTKVDKSHKKEKKIKKKKEK